jgi:ferric-dicitrate binding protein FerR (iron transport regulator)
MDTWHNRDDELLAQLIQKAGRREQPPRADYERVMAAATDALQAKLRRRRRRRVTTWLSVGVAAAAVVGAVLLNVAQRPAHEIARIDRAIGTVDTRSDKTASWAGIDDEHQALVDGEWLRTSPGSRLGLTLAGGISLRLDGSTEILLEAVDRIALSTGKVYVDSGQSPADNARMEIVTPAGIATDVGTQFEVRYAQDELRLRVREGRVNLHGESGELSSVAGDQLVIDAAGSVTRARIALDDPDWQWAESIAPTPSMDERPVSALLEWVGRETGRVVQYEQPILEMRATTTILHGSIRNLEPLKALDVMLATTDFEYTILDDGTILIRNKTTIY